MNVKKIFEFISKNVPSLKDTEFFSKKFEKLNGVFVVGSSTISLDVEDVHICFTMAAQSDTVFLTVTDGDVREITSILSFIEYLDVAKQPVDIGHTLRPESDYLNEEGREGCVFLLPETLPLLGSIPYKANIDGKDIKFLFVVFLSSEEMSVKLEKGFDALLDLFSEQGKDVMRISAVNH